MRSHLSVTQQNLTSARATPSANRPYHLRYRDQSALASHHCMVKIEIGGEFEPPGQRSVMCGDIDSRERLAGRPKSKVMITRRWLRRLAGAQQHCYISATLLVARGSYCPPSSVRSNPSAGRRRNQRPFQRQSESSTVSASCSSPRPYSALPQQLKTPGFPALQVGSST